MTLAIVGFIATVLAVVLVIRNEWVFQERVRFAVYDHDGYERLPSYSLMVVMFWRWDVTRFLRERQ